MWRVGHPAPRVHLRTVQLTPDQTAVQELAREFAQAEIAPNAATWDREHHFPRELFTRLGAIGLMGVCVPEELGGAGADFVSYILAVEELSRADAGVGVTVAVHTSAGTLPALRHARPAVRDVAIPPLARGEGLAAFALTESGSGSDAGSLRTAARSDGNGGWVIDGAKQWITNGSYASEFVVFARTRPDVPGPGGISAFLVEGGTPGLEAVREEEKLGLNSSSTADLAFDGVQVPDERLLGEEGRGFAIAMETLDSGRITHRGAGARRGAGGPRLRARLRARARDVRQAHRRARAGAGPAGGHGHAGRRRPRPDLRRRAPAGTPAARTRWRARRPSSSPRASRGR